MKRFGLIITILIVNVQFSMACSCDFLTVKEAYRNTSFIFHGKVLSKERASRLETMDDESKKNLFKNAGKDSLKVQSKDLWRVEIKILEILKGEHQSKIVTIFTPMSSSGCGYADFEIDKEFVVYGLTDFVDFFYIGLLVMYDFPKISPLKGIYWTSLCSRTTFEIKEELAALRKIIKEE